MAGKRLGTSDRNNFGCQEALTPGLWTARDWYTKLCQHQAHPQVHQEVMAGSPLP